MNLMILGQVPVRRFSLSSVYSGGVRMKRKKQAMRAENPHLPARNVDKTPKVLALANFDQYYSQYFGPRWASMRLALLSRQKYCAVVNNFADPETTVKSLRDLGCINITELFKERVETKVKLQTVPIEDIIEPKASSDKSKVPETESTSNVISEDLETDHDTDYSLKPDMAAERYIDPDEKVIGDMSTSMYDFVPTSSLKGMEDFVEEQDYYDYYQTVERDSVPIQVSSDISIPKHLQIFTFPRNVLDLFPQPSAGVSGNLNYYCMDGGSLFPVLALDLRPGQDVLDLCAAPGGKSLLALQTLYPRKLVCNDINRDRLSRLD